MSKEEMSYVKPQKTKFDEQSNKPEKEIEATGPKRIAGVSVDIEMAHNEMDLKKSDPIKISYNFAGIPISIEWMKGEHRMYGAHNEKQGKLMVCDYGYFDDTLSADGEELDLYCGDNKESRSVYLLLQKPTPYDIEHGVVSPEEKWMLGFDSLEQAKGAYEACMPVEWFLTISEIKWDDFIEHIETCKKEIEKAVSNDHALNEYLGLEMPGCDGDWAEAKEEFKKSMKSLKKYVEDISGNANKLATENSNFSDSEKSIECQPNKYRLKLAKALFKMSEMKVKMPVKTSPISKSMKNLAKSLGNLENQVANIPQLVFKVDREY